MTEKPYIPPPSPQTLIVLGEIQRAIGRLEGDVRSFHDSFVKHDDEDKKMMTAILALGERVDVVEKKNAYHKGVFATLAALAGGATAGLVELVRRFT